MENNYKIKILGIGGGGSNTIDYIVESNKLDLQNIETYAVNTDAQALENSKADKKIHIGKLLTKGLGAGAVPNVGKKAAEESMQEIIAELRGADIVFIASGMGGGTGTGAAPFIAEISKNLGILTIGVVTKPFNFEGPSRMLMATEGLRRLEKVTDVTIVIPNEKLIENHKDEYLEAAFTYPDEVLRKATDSVVRILTNINTIGVDIDLNTLKVILSNQGLAVLGIGESNDEDKDIKENLKQALDNAVDSHILENSINGAKRFLVLVGANIDYYTMSEETFIIDYFKRELGYEFQIITTVKDEEEANEYYRSITLIATGYEEKPIIEKAVEDSTNKYNSNMFSEI